MDNDGSAQQVVQAEQRQQRVVVVSFVDSVVVQRAEFSAQIAHFVLVHCAVVVSRRNCGIHVHGIPMVVQRGSLARELQVFFNRRLRKLKILKLIVYY